jgi:hypothetical protein
MGFWDDVKKEEKKTLRKWKSERKHDIGVIKGGMPFTILFVLALLYFIFAV